MFEDDFTQTAADENNWQKNCDTITYDENWQNVSQSEYPKVVPPDEAAPEPENKPGHSPRRDNSPRHLLLIIQLVLCACAALCAFALKQFGGDRYDAVRNWYYSQLNASVIADGRTAFDLSSLFKPTPDEV